jgi:hypothetical protein
MALLSVSASAKVDWGVRAGVARSSLVQKVDVDYWSGSRPGGSVAVLGDVPFHGRFSFRPEVALVYQGGSFHSDPEDGLSLLRHRVESCSLLPSCNVAFNVPLSDVKMSVYGGPAVDFHLWHSTGAVKSFDLGVNAGISVEYAGVFFSINTLSGTSDRRTDKTGNESPVYQNSLTFSLGYFFR